MVGFKMVSTVVALLVASVAAKDDVSNTGVRGGGAEADGDNDRVDAMAWAAKMLAEGFGVNGLEDLQRDAAADEASRKEMAALEVSRPRSPFDGDDNDDDDDTCPFVYDEYLANFELPIAGEVVWRFRPKDYGFSHGYYCSLSSEVLGEDIEYRFGNCSCPPARYCKHDWGFITAKLPMLHTSTRMHVGKCQIYSWILAVPIVIFFLITGCCLISCIRRRSSTRHIIVVREDPRSGYVSMN